MRYTINEMELPGVTTVLGLLDKPFLKQWAANQAIDYLLERSAKTGILSVSDLELARTAYKNASNRAKSIGSEVHAIIEKYIKLSIYDDSTMQVNKTFDRLADWSEKHVGGSEAEKIKQGRNAFGAFLDWVAAHNVEFLEAEKPICCLEYCYAGTADLLCRMDGKIYLIDFKTSKSFYDGYGKQVAAYKKAREEKKKNDQINVVFRGEVEFEKTIDYKPVKIEGIGVLRLDKETGLPEFKDYTKQYDRKLKSFLALLDFYYLDKKRRLKNNRRV